VNPSGVPYKKLQVTGNITPRCFGEARTSSDFTRADADFGLRAFVVILGCFLPNFAEIAAGYDNKICHSFND
jgi:hypothetical protein